MIKQSINSFSTTTSTGIEKLPNEQFVYVESTKLFYIKDNNTGMVAGKTIQDAITAGCLIEAGKRVCLPQLLVSASYIFWGQYDLHFIYAQNYSYTYQPISHLSYNSICDTSPQNAALEISERVYFDVREDGSVTVTNMERNQADGILGLPDLIHPPINCLKYFGYKSILSLYPYFKVIRINTFDGEIHNAAPMYYNTSTNTLLQITRFPGGDGSSIPEFIEITFLKILPSGASSSGTANPLDILCVSTDQSTITTEGMPIEVSYSIE